MIKVKRKFMCVLVKYRWLSGSASVFAILVDGVQDREKD